MARVSKSAAVNEVWDTINESDLDKHPNLQHLDVLSVYWFLFSSEEKYE